MRTELPSPAFQLLKNRGFARFLLSLVVFSVLFANPGTVTWGAPMDAVVGFYTSPVPLPPKIPVCVASIMEVLRTGDVVIENDRAFPQWYVAIAAIVPGTKYVHAGVAIKGKEVIWVNSRFAKTLPDKKLEPIMAHKWQLVDIPNSKKPKKAWRWMPVPIDPDQMYIVTPGGVGVTGANVVALFDLNDYLTHPSYGSVKHIKVIRPNLTEPLARAKIVEYLCIHLALRTGYDMGFSLSETEPSSHISDVMDVGFKTVPVYCTELCLRALEKGGITTPVIKLEKGVLGKIKGIPGLPKAFVQKISENFITADCFVKSGKVVYENSLPPVPGKAFAVMMGGEVKNVMQAIGNSFRHLFKPD